MQTYSYLDREYVSSEQKPGTSMMRRRNKAAESGTVALMWLNAGLMVSEMTIHGLMLGGLISAAATTVMFQKQISSFLAKFDKIQRRYGINIYAVLFAVLTLFFIIDFSAAPANAQFFQRAQTWITNTGFANNGNPDTIATVAAVFNVLRILFLLYIAVSVVNVIQAVRRDEDWASAARTPLIILTGVFAGDFLTTLIT